MGLPRRTLSPYKHWPFPWEHVPNHDSGIKAKPEVVVIWVRGHYGQVLELPEWLRHEGQKSQGRRKLQRRKARWFMYKFPSSCWLFLQFYMHRARVKEKKINSHMVRGRQKLVFKAAKVKGPWEHLRLPAEIPKSSR